MKKLVLFIEWSAKGRDFEIDLPLMYFFEKKLNWKVKYLSIFNLPKIISLSPDIIIMSNTTGAYQNYQLSKLIKKSDIPLFSHVSEGMFREEHLDNALWGWNTKKEFNEIYTMLWSEYSLNISLKKYDYLKNVLRVSGSVGHDKYSIFETKQTIIKDKKYKMIIGYACFDFHNIISNREKLSLSQSRERIDYIINSIEPVNQLLLDLISNNKDILFIAKAHPGDGDKIPYEVNNLDKFDNFKLVDKEHSIVDIIQEVDIWMSFNSSTNLEAWLFKKPTIVFATSDLIRSSSVVDGSIRENKFIVIQSYIEEFKKNNFILDFENKNKIREELIKKLIGYSDGLNHIRFMSFLKSYIDDIEKKNSKKVIWSITYRDKIKYYLKHIIYTISKSKYNIPYIKKWAHIYDMFDEKEIEKQKKLRYPDFDKFYKKNLNKIDFIYKNFSNNWNNHEK